MATQRSAKPCTPVRFRSSPPNYDFNNRSGEYLDSIRTVDSELLNKLEDPYVLTFPTAAGQESSSRIDYWSDLANEHFSKLGVRHKNFQALDSKALNSSEVLKEVEKANFIYFSGGNPNYLYSQIVNTSFTN